MDDIKVYLILMAQHGSILMLMTFFLFMSWFDNGGGGGVAVEEQIEEAVPTRQQGVKTKSLKNRGQVYEYRRILC
jgi:hypothetical protein